MAPSLVVSVSRLWSCAVGGARRARRAGKFGDDARRDDDLANQVVLVVRHEEKGAIGVRCHAERSVETRGRARAVGGAA
jgi:hypothetical protein